MPDEEKGEGNDVVPAVKEKPNNPLTTKKERKVGGQDT